MSDTAAQDLKRRCRRHLEDLRRLEKPPRDVDVKAGSVLRRILPPEGSSGGGSPAAMCSEMA